MSNNSLVSQMRLILDDYEAGRKRSTEVEREFRSHMECVEGIRLSTLHEASDLTDRLVIADLSDSMRDLFDAERVASVLSDLRQFLCSLP